MGHRDMIWSRHQPAQLLAWGIRFFLAAALTATQTPGDYAPFALGCVAACGPGAGGIAALLGAGVGAVLFLDFSGALPFLAAAILIFTTAAAFQGLKLMEGPLFHPLAGAGERHLRAPVLVPPAKPGALPCGNGPGRHLRMVLSAPAAGRRGAAGAR